MRPSPIVAEPAKTSYDVVIIGGAIIGSSVAWFLSNNSDFEGSILVVERDTTYEHSSTAHTNSCMRQQFSNELNVQMSQFAAENVRNFRDHMGADSPNGDPETPDLAVDHFGYMYFAEDETFAKTLRDNQKIQAELGAGTKIMSPSEIAADYPFYNLDGIICGSHNLVDEGYFDSGTMFDWWRKRARANGVEYLSNEVVGIGRSGDVITDVTLKTGEVLTVGTVVNASGPRAATTAAMAGLDLPVEPRIRYTFVFNAAEPLEQRLPLTIDPSGVHVRTEGQSYMGGATPDLDAAVEPDNFKMDDNIFEEKVWPALANRIPAFERIKVIHQWAGHYAHNTVDHNVVVGPHHEVANFIFVNGFSGHGLQQSPAMGRGVSELIAYGEYRALDLGPLGYDRIVRNEPFVETAII